MATSPADRLGFLGLTPNDTATRSDPVAQLALMLAIVFLALQDPIQSPALIGLGALLVAAASATQDIVIDTLRVETLPVEEQAAGMAGYVAAYRIGMLVSGAGVIAATAWLELKGFSKEAVWPIAYTCAGLLLALGMLATLLAREPHAEEESGAHAPAPGLARVIDAAKGALAVDACCASCRCASVLAIASACSAKRWRSASTSRMAAAALSFSTWASAITR